MFSSFELDLAQNASSALVHGLPMKARCLTAQEGETDRTKFFIGTLDLREENELHLIEVSETDRLEVTSVVIYNHPREIWHIAPSPSDPNLLFTCYNTGAEFQASMWRIEGDEPTNLKETFQLREHFGSIKSVLWQPLGEEGLESNRILSLDSSSMKVWDLKGGATHATSTIQIDDVYKLGNASWNPHNLEEVATIVGPNIQGWDIRSNTRTFTIPKAHSAQTVRDLDFNPNKLYYLVTAGDDCYVRFWDERNTSKPLKVLEGHTHWVWSVRYNRARDQLLLSASTDSSVNLWKVSSLSSVAPSVEEQESGLPSMRVGPSDYLIKSYDEHEHSVYSVAWGSEAGSPYIFASLSYDGRVVISQVPEAEIEKIQLEEL